MDDTPQQPSIPMSPSGRSTTPSGRAKEPLYISPARNPADVLTLCPDALGLYGYATPQANTTVHPSPSSLDFLSQPSSASGSVRTIGGTTEGWPRPFDQQTMVSGSPWSWDESISVPASTTFKDDPIFQSMLSHNSSVSYSYEASAIYSIDDSHQSLFPNVKIEQQQEDWSMVSSAESTSRTSMSLDGNLKGSPESFQTVSGPSVPQYERSRTLSICQPVSKMERCFQTNHHRVRSSSMPEHTTEVEEGDATQIERKRKRRQLTTEENANWECPVCGRFFERSYNYSTHMKTHDPDRPRPNLCQHPGCGKRFVRKNDLTRHNASVHSKERKYRCKRCEARFPRKDTLRRHVEDGCPRRFDLQQQPDFANLSPPTQGLDIRFYRFPSEYMMSPTPSQRSGTTPTLRVETITPSPR